MGSNIVLIGMMGSGKTTVGKMVAGRTGFEFVDMDDMIVARAGKSIPAIFDEGGEEAFRLLETEALHELQAATHAVIASGGGAVGRAENRRLLRQLGTVFWLDAPAETIMERIGHDEGRPMLRGGALKRIEQLLAERREFYAETSDIHLDTSELTVDEIAEHIRKQVELQIPEAEEEEDIFATIVAIDGPVGAGKSALARALAQRLNYVHVDTGAMYRCVTCEAMRRGVPLDDAGALTALSHSIDIRFVTAEELNEEQAGAVPAGAESKRVLLNGEDVTELIRSPEVTRNTSPVADAPGVRAELVNLQRQIALHGRSVLEGRDIGTVVVPEAKWKIYLVASLVERIERRRLQYEQQGVQIGADELRNDVIVRDERDRARPQGALRLAQDAIIFDNTGIPLDEIVETMAVMIESGQT